MSADAKEIIRRFDAAKGLRVNWEWHWQEVADLVLPTRDFTVSGALEGNKRHNRIIDSTAAEANVSCASALFGLLVNPSIRWVSLGIEDYIPDEEGRAWLYDSTTRLLNYCASTASGFYLTKAETFQDKLAFGCSIETATVTSGWLKFMARPLAAFYVVCDDDGNVCQQYRAMQVTIRDAAKMFGGEKLSEKSRKKLLDSKQADEKIQIVHSVYRRDEYDPESRLAINKPWASCYVEVDAQHPISEGGFDDNPFIFSRWDKAPGETYGRGIAMNILPRIKGVNAMAKTVLDAGAIATRPPMMVPVNGMVGPLRIAPASINYMRAGSRDEPKPMITGSDPRIGWEMIKEERKQIHTAYYYDAFTLPEIDRMTAEEVITRRQQGLIKSASAHSRVTAEDLNPSVARIFNWLKNTDRLLPVPASLQGRRIIAEYRGPMSLAQSASESQNFMQAMGTVNGLVTVDPTALDSIDADEVVRGTFNGHNVNPRFLRPAKAVQAMREARSKQQAAAAQISLLQGGAAAARDAAAGLKDAATANAA